MRIINFTKRRRSGFTVAEVLLSLFAIGAVIAIFTSLNNFQGVKNEEYNTKMNRFEKVVADIQNSMRNNPEVSAEKACDANFLANYYLDNLDGATKLSDYKVNDKNVTAINIPGYGVLAILPNSDNGYCKEEWDNENLNISNPPVAFIAISEEVASERYYMPEISVDNGKFDGITNPGMALFTGKKDIVLSANKKSEERMDNTQPYSQEFSCNTAEHYIAAKKEFLNTSNQYNYCTIGTPFKDENIKIATYCCTKQESQNYTKINLHMGHYSSLKNNCGVSFCQGNGFINEDAKNTYTKCIAGDESACSKVEIKDSGKVNFYCKTGIENAYTRCGCPNDRKYWVSEIFFKQKYLLGYGNTPMKNGECDAKKGGDCILNGACVENCESYKNEKNELMGLIGKCEDEKEENCSCECPSNMQFSKEEEKCVCINENLLYQKTGCICPDKTNHPAEYNKLIEKIKEENTKYSLNRIYKQDAEEAGCSADCPSGQVTEDGIKCIPSNDLCKDFTVRSGSDCICPENNEENITKSGNIWTNKNGKSIKLEDNEIYNKENPTKCKSTCSGNLEPNIEKTECVCKKPDNMKTYEYYTGDKASNCMGQCSQYQQPKKVGLQYTCGCYENAQEAIDAVKLDNITLAEDEINKKLEDLKLTGFTGNYKYDNEGNVTVKWDTTKNSCMSTCPTEKECEEQGMLVDYDGCACKPIPSCDNSECCVPGEIVIDNTQKLLSIGQRNKYPANGHYCVTENIEIKLNEINNPILKEKINNLLPITPNGFTGTMKGLNHKISGLNLTTENPNEGLFAKIGDFKATTTYPYSVTDLAVEGSVDAADCSTGNKYVGLLAGVNSGIINKVSVEGFVRGCEAGAIVGFNSGTIKDSSALGKSQKATDGTTTYTTNVIGQTCAGGFIANNSGTITGSFVRGAKIQAFDGTNEKSGDRAGGFVCINTNIINHSFVDAGNISALSSAGFVSENSGTIQSAYVEGEDIIVDGTEAAGFINTNTKVVKNVYVYNINLIGNTVAGFVNTNNKTIENVYAILKNYQIEKDKVQNPTDVNVVFTPKATENNIINSYFGKENSSNIDSLSACTSTLNDCKLKDEKVVREEDEFKATPSPDIYNDWSNDVWCFNCHGRALLREMPTEAKELYSQCQTRQECSPCIERLHEQECEGNQEAVFDEKSKECVCSCKGVKADDAYNKLTEQQKKWYVEISSDDGQMCLDCGSYKENGKKVFDYVHLTEGENAGYCGCPPKKDLPSGYLGSNTYIQGGAKKHIDNLSCKDNSACAAEEPTGFKKEIYQYYNPENPTSCLSNCTINGRESDGTCEYLKAGTDDAHSCQCFDTAKQAKSKVKNNEILNSLKEIKVPANISNSGKEETIEVIIGEEGLPVQFWDKNNPNEECLSACPTNETCKTGVIPELCYCKKPCKTGDPECPNPVPSECTVLEAPILINNTQSLQSIGNLSAYPADGNYCIWNDITFTPSNLTNPELKEMLVGDKPYNKFIPLTPDGEGFTGTIVGLDHTIKKLDIVDVINNNTGMISLIGENGTVKDLKIESSTIIGINENCNDNTGFAGILVGQNKGTIDNVKVTGTVTACNAGGVAGINRKTIQNSFTTNTRINGTTCAGGFVSKNTGTVTLSYVDGTNTFGAKKAGGFVCINDNEINHSFVVGGNVSANNSAGFANTSTNEGKINSVYVEGTEITVSEINNAEQNSAGFINENTGLINDAYVFSTTLNGGTAVGFVSNNKSSNLKNVYSVIDTDSKAVSIGGFTTSIEKQEYAPQNVHWAMLNNEYTGVINSCVNNNDLCKNNINKRLITDFYVTPSVDMYNTWSSNIWCFSCIGRALLKGMPAEATKLHSVCETDNNKCPLDRCGKIKTPDNGELDIELVLNTEGICVCPYTCSVIDTIFIDEDLFECDSLMEGKVQDTEKGLYCVKYKCEDKVTQLEGYDNPNIRLAYDADSKKCGCPSESAFAKYLQKYTDLKYDVNWKNTTNFEKSNFSCLTNRNTCPEGERTIYKDKKNNEFVFIEDNVYMYNTKSKVLTKDKAIEYCQTVGSELPLLSQIQKAKLFLGEDTVGVSWNKSIIQKEETKFSTWCFANANKVKELQDKNDFSCEKNCPIKCTEKTLYENECSCEELECPDYDALYVVRYKGHNNIATLYDQCMGNQTNVDESREVSEHFKQIARELSSSDKNRKFDKFHAYIIGVKKNDKDVITDAKVVAAISPRVWYYKFTAELTDVAGIPLDDLKGTTNYEYVNPDLLNITCSYKIDDKEYNSNNYTECADHNATITSANCKSQTEVEPYIKGYAYNSSVSSCRGSKNTFGTFDKIGYGMQSFIDEYARSTDCKQLCKQDGLENDNECLFSCENVSMEKNIYEGCSEKTEFCTGGSIYLLPPESGCPPVDVDETFRRYTSPLILDLLGNGLRFTSVENGVRFDLDADGIAEQIAWTDFQKEFDDAFLWYDKNNDGKILNGKELFGDQNGAKNGFYELAKYDKNKDNVINKDDAIYEKLKLWVDFNKNAQINDGEIKTLSEAGVIEIPLEFYVERDKNGNIKTDEFGNKVGLVGKFKQLIEAIVDGVTTLIEKIGTMIDVFFASK